MGEEELWRARQAEQVGRLTLEQPAQVQVSTWREKEDWQAREDARVLFEAGQIRGDFVRMERVREWIRAEQDRLSDLLALVL